MFAGIGDEMLALNRPQKMTETIQRIVLASRPIGEPTLDNFRSEKLPIPHLGSD
jgi:NADPH-dependent curcumin reductase CurA